MKTIKELDEKLDTMNRLYGKGIFNKFVEAQKNVLRNEIRIRKDFLELIDEMDGYYETIISDKCISKKELKARIEGEPK